MIRHGLLVLTLMAGDAARAETLLGPGDVWPTFEYGLCDAYSVDLDCLRSAGAPEGALRFIQAAAEDPDIGILVIPTHLTELGVVDLVDVDIPGLANTNWQQMLVNGDPPVIWLANWSNMPALNDAGTRAVLRKHPQAFPAGMVTVVGHRILPDGIQRFVVADILADGCRACDMVGSALFQLEFVDGVYSSVLNLGWVLPEAEGNTAQMAADLRRGDTALLQSLLNIHGYQAGPMDGHFGPQTRDAMDQFKSEHCLAGEDDLSSEVISALTDLGSDFASPPCGATLRSPIVEPLGLPDGMYVSDERLCPPANLSDFGDVAYSRMVVLKGNRFEFSEQSCTVHTAVPHDMGIYLNMSCSAEGYPEDRQVDITPQPPDAFRWRDSTFRLCGAAAEATDAVASVIFPLPDNAARVNAIFGAAGPGPESDPKTYFVGQYHVGVDLRAGAGTPVRAPVDGTIIYYHRRAGDGTPRWLQTFIVLRDAQNRDWILAHVDCSVCGTPAIVGDSGSWPASARQPVKAGDVIGTVADLTPEGYGPHLHLGLSTRPLVGSDGVLLPMYRAGNWARLRYDEGTAGALDAAEAQAIDLGFVDPMSELRP